MFEEPAKDGTIGASSKSLCPPRHQHTMLKKHPPIQLGCTVEAPNRFQVRSRRKIQFRVTRVHENSLRRTR
jgi:hypothetical protein